MEKRIKNTSKSFLKKLFGKENVDALIATENGIRVQMEKTGEKAFSYEDIKAMKVNFYLDPTTPYKTVTLVTNMEEEYSLNVDPNSGEVEFLSEMFAHHQLKGKLPEKMEEIDLDLFFGVNEYTVKLQGGYLLESIKGEEMAYPWESLEYYRIDKPADTIRLKFKEKKTFVNLLMHHVTNLPLLLSILEKFGKKQ